MTFYDFTTEFTVFDPESFDPESFDPESFDPELMTEGLMTEGLRPKGEHREKRLKLYKNSHFIVSLWALRSLW